MRAMVITAITAASLACAANWNAAGAASPAGSAAQVGTQQVAPAHTKTTSKARSKSRRSKVERPQTNWLNPQPEPPSPAGNKPVHGGNWLNPQPEPPRPDTTKKLH